MTAYASAVDAQRYQRTILVMTGIVFGQFALSVAGIIPFWAFLLTCPIVIPRWMLAVHELFHVKKPDELDAITRLLPMGFSPLVLGYREYREIHSGHHRFMCTEADPEWFQLKGGYFSGWLNATLMPERALILWVNTHGISKSLAWSQLIHLSLFCAMVYWAGWDFFWYWIPARLSYGLATFSFFYMLHRRGDQVGVYPVNMPLWAASVFCFLYGHEAYLATCHHDIHHKNQRIAAHALGLEAKDGVKRV